jgi:predicted HTH domain antitoxin
VFSRRYEKNYLEKVTDRLQTSRKERTDQRVKIRLSGRAVQYRTSEVRIRLRDSPGKKTDTADRQIPQEKELLKRIQEPDYKTEEFKSLVYVVKTV